MNALEPENNKQVWNTTHAQLNDVRAAIVKTDASLKSTHESVAACNESMSQVSEAVTELAEVLQHRVRRDVDEAITTAVQALQDNVAGALAASMTETLRAGDAKFVEAWEERVAATTTALEQTVRASQPQLIAAWQERVGAIATVSAIGLQELQAEMARASIRFQAANEREIAALAAEVDSVIRSIRAANEAQLAALQARVDEMGQTSSRTTSRLAATAAEMQLVQTATEESAQLTRQLASNVRHAGDAIFECDQRVRTVSQQVAAMESRLPDINATLALAHREAAAIRDYMEGGGKVANDAAPLLLRYKHLSGWRRWLIRMLLGA